MFVIEQGHNSTTLTEHSDDLIEKALPRIHPLPTIVQRIVAVLANRQHTVHCQ